VPLIRLVPLANVTVPVGARPKLLVLTVAVRVTGVLGGVLAGPVTAVELVA